MFTKEAPRETIASRTQQGLEKFDIRNFQHELEATKVKGKYICPVCEGHNFSIDQKTGKYQCFNGCECKDIREEIRPLAQAIAEQKGDNYTPLPRWKKALQKIVEPKPVPIPGDCTLVMLPEPATDIPQPQQLTSRPPKEVPGSATEIIYSYSESQWVTRYQWQDASKEKGHGKTFRQWHRREDGIPEMRKGNAFWEAYRLNEAIAAAKSVAGTPALLQHEGEGCVEIGRAHGLAGITFQGSGWDRKTIIPGYQRAKEEGIGLIVFLHDPDDTGLKKLQTCQDCAAEVGIAFIGINPHDICPDLPYKSSDIKEILAQMDTPEFIRRLEQEIHAAVAERSQQEQVNVTDAEDSSNNQETILNFTQIAFEALYADKNWISADDKLYCHMGNHYKHHPDSEERPRITSFCNSYGVKNDKGKTIYPYATPAYAKKVLEWAKMLVEINPELLNPPGISCTNGVVRPIWIGNKVTPRLDPHTPQDYFIYEPLIEYDPNADSTDCDRLLDCLDEPQQQVLLRNLAASIDLETVRKLKGREIKALLAVGLGSNGKDALRECVSTIYGEQGITSISLADFQFYDQGRKFYLAPLMYSRVNWASENPQTSKIDKIQSLKLFVTGNKLHCEHKGKDHVEFTPKATGLFNLNETPSFQGAMQASIDRFAVIQFLKTFKINPDPNNPNELLADPRFDYDKEFVRTKVAPAFLNKMFQALSDLIEFGIDYECTSDAFRNLQKENNHLFEFIEEVNLGYAADAEMTAKDLWSLIEQYYIQNGTLVIDPENNRRAWVDQVRPSDKNVKGINQIIPRISQLFPKAVKATRYCDIAKRNIPVLRGIGIIDPTRTTFESTRTSSAPLSAPETTLNQDFRTTRTTFSDFEENIEEKSEHTLQVDLFSPPMKNDEYPPQSGAGSAEPLQNKENYCGNRCGGGAGEVESGAGMPIQDKAATPTTITSDTALVETKSDISYSLLQIEEDGGDISKFVGSPVEVRSLDTGIVKFVGQMISFNLKNGFITLMTEEGNKDAHFREAFVIG
ncbi:MAG: DUF5906 domain-containing protein [Nostoc sp.]